MLLMVAVHFFLYYCDAQKLFALCARITENNFDAKKDAVDV